MAAGRRPSQPAEIFQEDRATHETVITGGCHASPTVLPELLAYLGQIRTADDADRDVLRGPDACMRETELAFY